MFASALILIRRGENPAQCTVRRLRGEPGLSFAAYPLRRPLDLSRHLLLFPGEAVLTPADASRPLLLLDSSWRYADKMARALGPLERRALPAAWQTAYPRRSKIHTDPAGGLATVEALFAAWCIFGRRRDSLLRFYPWREEFLKLNQALLPPADSIPGLPEDNP